MTMESKIVLAHEVRPCLVTTPRRGAEPETRRALLHCFALVAEVIPPSNLRGGHNGGQLAGLTALVEFEDGTVQRVEPECVQLLDSAGLFREYAWPEEKKEEVAHTCDTCTYSDTPSKQDPCCYCTNGDEWEARQ